MATDDNEQSGDGRGTVIVAMLANIGITIAKALAFLFTGSTSMLAETAHSVADTANQGLLLFGYRQAGKQADRAHPFGYGRERYFWPFVYSILIFVMGAVVAWWQGITALLDPGPVERPAWAFAVLGLSLLLDGGSLLNARRQADRERSGRSYWRFVQRSRDPEIPVVLLEDSAAVTGLGMALTAVVASVAFGWHAADALGSLAIGTLLAGVAFVLAREMKSLLIGEPATPEQEQRIRVAVQDHEDFERIVLLRSLHLGPEELLVDLKVQVCSDLDADAVARAIDGVERDIRERVPAARIIAVEPDLPRASDPDIPAFARSDGT